MGNCLRISKNENLQYDLLPINNEELKNRKLTVNSDLGGTIQKPKECSPSGDVSCSHDESHVSDQNDGSGYKTNLFNSSKKIISFYKPSQGYSHQKSEQSDQQWLNYPNCKPDGEKVQDNDSNSSFAETWDPALFDQGAPNTRKAIPFSDQLCYGQRSYMNHRQSYRKNQEAYYIERWPSSESLRARHLKNNRLPLVSTSILGFSVLQSDVPDSLEWYRNGELESPQLNATNFLIKGKCSNGVQQNEHNENNFDPDITQLPPSREGWLRYTMFLNQDKTDEVEFHNSFKKAKHTFLSLESTTGCEIRFSRRLFIYKGKFVRTVVIDGPSRRHILRCHSSLPKLLTKLMILECERPSIYDPKINYKTMENEANNRIYSALFHQTPIAV